MDTRAHWAHRLPFYYSWDRGLVAGAFSFGYLASGALSPFVGRLMDSHGPRLIIESGVALTGLGALVGAGTNLISFTAPSSYLPNWFVKRRDRFAG